MLPRAADLLRAGAIGLGATAALDLWNLLLLRAFGIRSLDYGLLGRWIAHFPEGVLHHASIAKAAPKPFERPLGWTAHYLIGTKLAIAFVLLAGTDWLAAPTLLPALLWGLATVAFPFLLLQPALGLGFASSKSPNPRAARLKSLASHAIYGVGLWLTALALAATVSGRVPFP